MPSMRIIDLHCDTITQCHTKQLDLQNNSLQLSLHMLNGGAGHIQAFAIFMPDHLRGKPAIDYFEENYLYFKIQLQKYQQKIVQVQTLPQIDAAFAMGKIGALLTVEGGSALGGDLARIPYLRACGVRVLTLTWNAQNELAGGRSQDTGFTPLGLAAVPMLEASGIILDVSHLGDTAFAQLLQVAQRPFMASHSNSRSVCNHPRNLTDNQFRQILTRGGFVGLNFCKEFLSKNGNPSFEDFMDHIHHFIALGGADYIGLGSDFDGATLPAYINRADMLANLAKNMIKSGLSTAQTEKILWKNAYAFFGRTL